MKQTTNRYQEKRKNHQNTIKDS